MSSDAQGGTPRDSARLGDGPNVLPTPDGATGIDSPIWLDAPTHQPTDGGVDVSLSSPADGSVPDLPMVGGTGGLGATGGIPSGGVTGAGGVVGTGGAIHTGGASSPGGITSAGGTIGTGGGRSGTGGMGSGGLSTTGGMTGNGGANGTGGLVGTGGSNGSGGLIGTGGVMGSGGTVSTGGVTGSGGTVGTGGSSGMGGALGTGGTTIVGSPGCGKTPTLGNSSINTTTSGRQYILRWPDNYDNNHRYRLILDFHGAGGTATEIAANPAFFGLYDLSGGSTIFIAPNANGGYWSASQDVVFVDDILTQVEADLCIDLARIELEGFSQGGAMVRTLACARPGVFRAAVAHSAGGLTLPGSCQPIPYLGSLGLNDISGQGQNTQTDPFAGWDGCTIETLPTAPVGGHACSDYRGCPSAYPVRWCSFDGPHTPSPIDSGQSTSWMPSEVWAFFGRF